MDKKIKRNIDYTLSTFAAEGLKPSEYAVKLYERMDKGEISLKKTIAAIERKYGVAGIKRV